MAKIEPGARGKYVITGSTNTSTFPFIFTGSTSSAWAAKQVTGNGYGAPATANEVSLSLAYYVQNSGGIVGLAPNANYTAPGSSSVANPFPPTSGQFSASSGIGAGSSVNDMILESNSVYYWSNVSATSLTILGWIDAVAAV